MLTIGIVGAENSHTAAIAKVLNVEKRVRGVRVTHVVGARLPNTRKLRLPLVKFRTLFARLKS